MSFEVFGVFLAAAIQGVIISIYGSKVSCDTSTTLPPRFYSLNNLTDFDNITSSPVNTTTTAYKPAYSKLVSFQIYFDILNYTLLHCIYQHLTTCLCCLFSILIFYA